ncbi:hypothetical protein [Microcoleus sp. B3-D7]|uniref:hypothetical protein n=1 Tax=Microcoleus sp. B3-D7 TaxID=2818659 RepID=UPI002FD4B48F
MTKLVSTSNSSDSSGLPDPVTMTYEQIVTESINNLAAKEDLRRSLNTEKKLSAKLKITEQLLALSERNEALAQQITAELIAERHTMVMPQFIPHTNFDPDLKLALDLDNLPPLPDSPPKTKRKLSDPKIHVKKVADMSLEEIQAELKIHRAKMEELDVQITSPDFDTRFNAQMEIRGLSPRMKKLNTQEIALLQHEIACMKKSLL